jgi:hypothetical protein
MVLALTAKKQATTEKSVLKFEREICIGRRTEITQSLFRYFLELGIIQEYLM